MSRVVTYANNKLQCFCHIQLDSKERILISIASLPSPGVKVIKLGLGGLLPKETIWEYSAKSAGDVNTYVETVMGMFHTPESVSTSDAIKHPLDDFRDRLLPLRSIAEVNAWLVQAHAKSEMRRGNA